MLREIICVAIGVPAIILLICSGVLTAFWTVCTFGCLTKCDVKDLYPTGKDFLSSLWIPIMPIVFYLIVNICIWKSEYQNQDFCLNLDNYKRYKIK